MGEIKGLLKRELRGDRAHRPAALDFERKYQRRRRTISIAVLVAAALAGGLGAQTAYDRGLAGALQWVSLSAVVSSIAGPFGLCHQDLQANCVVDGYTIEYNGDRVRMIDYDAPEIALPECPYELALGHQAQKRLLELLNSGPIAVTPRGDRDVDQYGRKLRLVTVSGQSVGNFLIGEGLAAPSEGRHHYWCR
jgi:endonuclease YncB( thermonuclease family)